MPDKSPVRYTCIMSYHQDRIRSTGRIMLSDTGTAKRLVALPVVNGDAAIERHQKDAMGIACDLGSTILQNPKQRETNRPEELAGQLPTSTWNQVFAAVDQLVRNRRLTPRQPSRFECVRTPSSAATFERKNSVAAPHAYRSCSESHLVQERIFPW